jgi:hypothetical protein
MHASNSESTNAYATKGSAFGNETDSLSASDAKSLKVVTGILTAIDFEIAAARSLSRVWHAEPGGHVYMVRTLERIAEHTTALRVIQAGLKSA